MIPELEGEPENARTGKRSLIAARIKLNRPGSELFEVFDNDDELLLLLFVLLLLLEL